VKGARKIIMLLASSGSTPKTAPVKGARKILMLLATSRSIKISYLFSSLAAK
jgi:hypothetical protein